MRQFVSGDLVHNVFDERELDDRSIGIIISAGSFNVKVFWCELGKVTWRRREHLEVYNERE